MDFIFDCFFEDTFEKITRSELQDRSSRRDVLDHLNAVISGCSDGQCVHTEEVARLAVLSAVKYHRDKRDANGDVCLMGKYHNILYIALRTCWDWGVRDSAVVVVLLVSGVALRKLPEEPFKMTAAVMAPILDPIICAAWTERRIPDSWKEGVIVTIPKKMKQEIYSCEKTFERIFLGALFGPNAPHFIAGWRSDFRDQDENTRAMVYFLHHATSLGFELPVAMPQFGEQRMVRFIDIPIESCGKASPLRVALQASAPDLLLILLRYGAEPHPPDGGSSAIFALLDKLVERDRHYVFQNVSCLNILLRNIPIIELPCETVMFGERKERFLERYGRLLLDRIIQKEQVFGIMPLKHLCRCRIRDLLRLNGQLPDGIDTLRLPRKLQRYIDLMEE